MTLNVQNNESFMKKKQRYVNYLLEVNLDSVSPLFTCRLICPTMSLLRVIVAEQIIQ